MGFLTDWLTDWIKGLLIEGIMGNLTGLFDTVNTRVGEIAVQVGTTPAAWNAGVFSLIRQLSETVIPLDGPCYMLGKCWTGAYCRYFRDAVLPNDPVLEAALTAEGPVPETRPCPICGRPFLPDGRTRYCSAACSATALRKQKRDYMRKTRR